MYISVQEIPNVINEYIQSVIVPKAQSKGMLAMLGFAIGGAGLANGVARMLGQYVGVGQTLGIVNADNKIEIADLKARLTKMVEMAGGSIPIVGGMYNLDQADINALMAIAEQHGIP